MNDNKLYERYQRQMILKEFGVEGQRKLLQAKVLVIGAGGLGCSALQYLAGAGVGTIGIVDDDMVSLSNLHRQILYSVKDIGFNKAERAAAVLHQLNPEIKIIAYPERLTVQNAFTIMEAYDIIIDGTDNFSSRYMINDACVLLNKTLVFGAVSQWEGQVAVFSPHPLKGGKEYEPVVTVSTRRLDSSSGDGGIEIRVSDNGNGIPQKVLDKIFQPFFTTKPTGQGTGLGLSLSYDIIKAHGGEITVETKEGEGSTFIIQLPG